VRYLLGLGTPSETPDADGFTALHYAVRGGHEDIVNILLDRGANIEAIDDRGRTALHLAVEHRHEDIVVLLIERGADFKAKVVRPSKRLLL
jgi:ankyrin repeat protein